MEVKAATHLVKRMFHSTSRCAEGKSLKLPTGGQPLCFQRTTRARIVSGEASTRSIRGRSSTMSDIRKVVAGSSAASNATQLAAELRRTGMAERESALREAGILSYMEVPEQDCLAMKASLAIPWHKLRHIRRWLSKWGLKLASESRTRNITQQLAPYDTTGELMPFVFTANDGEEIRTAPCVYTPHLVSCVETFLEELSRAQALTWYDGHIPTDEIWVKLGGDKGGGSFKMSFQIANTEKPNSAKNTFVFCYFKAGDTTRNLHIALGQYQQQVQTISTTTWDGKAIRVFIFGDYEFLARLFGISGHSGRHCCLWCHIDQQQIARPRTSRGPQEPRTLDSLHHDLQRFRSAGAPLKEAKNYNNVIGSALFHAPLDQVAIPALHVSLGIFQRLYELLENACHELDIKLARIDTTAAVEAKEAYLRYATQLKEIRVMEKRIDASLGEAETYQQMAVQLALQNEDTQTVQLTELLLSEAQKLRSEADSLRLKIQSTTPIKFALKDGPFMQGLEEALHSCGIDRQAYHGRTFIGNHVHKCLRTKSIQQLTAAVTETAAKLDTLKDEAAAIRTTFEQILNLFASCHDTYSKSKPISDAEIDQFSSKVDTFLEFYRKFFPDATITPKLHMLEDHMVPWMRRWHWALGFHGEQGAESIHNVFNTLERTYSAIQNPVQRMKNMLREHHLQVSPKIKDLQPSIVRRKK